MALDLRRQAVLTEPERLDDLAGELLPVDVGIRGEVCVEVADRAVHLRRHHEPVDLARLTLQALAHDRKLLADRRRGRGLAVRVREHRHLRVVLRHLDDLRRHLVHRAPEDLLSVPQHQRVRHVVDVLGGAAEVDELENV